MRVRDTKSFIEKSLIVHGDKYSYDKVEYVKSKEKVIITCFEHGDFYQRPNDHLNGHGCPSCKFDLLVDINKIDYLDRFIMMHGEKYDYSFIDFSCINLDSDIRIICSLHGEFVQKVSNHLYYGCNLCAIDYRSTLNVNKNFIEDFRNIHGDKYDYSLVEYVNNRSKVIIVCKEHGSFNQLPKAHLNGQGCPFCIKSKGELMIKNYLELRGIDYISEYKFDDCRNINSLPFDFYLINENICIEYDGIQHFEIVDLFGGEESFIKTKKNDNIKTNYCMDNGIRLIRISYKDYKKIFDILDKML